MFIDVHNSYKYKCSTFPPLQDKKKSETCVNATSIGWMDAISRRIALYSTNVEGLLIGTLVISNNLPNQ